MMSQKEKIESLEQRVQALEQKLNKVVRNERLQQSSSDAKPLPNRRQERLAKLEEGVENKIYFTKENGKIGISSVDTSASEPISSEAK